MKLMVILSPGWLFSKDETRFCTAVLAGLGPVVTSHMVAVAPSPGGVLPPPAEDPHATSKALDATATAASHLRPIMTCAGRVGLCDMASSKSPATAGIPAS